MYLPFWGKLRISGGWIFLIASCMQLEGQMIGFKENRYNSIIGFEITVREPGIQTREVVY
jgi:hypothetical protein